MRKRYSFLDLGSPTSPGIYASSDGTRVNLDRFHFDRWKSHEFRDSIVAKLVHDPEHIGNAVYTVVSL